MSSAPTFLAPLPWRVLVLGGTGFIGRHAVASLLARGHSVVIGTRRPHRTPRRLGHAAARCERRETHLQRLQREADWHTRLADIDAVINCVGILRPRGAETYERVHHDAPAALARACATRNIRLVHVSALGLDRGRSGFLVSKRRGERAVLASNADAVVVRPSLLDGAGGFGARWLRRVADWPLHPYPANARGRIAVMAVTDLGECLAKLVLAPAGAFAEGRTRVAELGGPVEMPIADVIALLRSRDKPAPPLAVPAVLVRLGAHLCDLLHLTPLSFGHYELLQYDNAPRHNLAGRLLGRTPAPIGRQHERVTLPEQGMVLR